MGKILCLGYVRYSSEAQSDGNSRERQLDNIRKYAENNNLILKDENIFEDLGVSGFSGKNRTEGNLSRLLVKIENGGYPAGSVLVTESIDRLTREHIYIANELFSKLFNNNIKIVSLIDNKIYTKDNTIGDVIQLLVTAFRGHDESATKEYRSSKNWQSKRDKIKECKLTSKCPAWLRLSEDKKSFIVIDDRAELINIMYDMSYSGIGIKSITNKFNSEKIPTWDTRTLKPRKTLGWQHSYIGKILTSRAVLGEFQTHMSEPVTKKRVPVGEVLLKYFPPIIDEEMFYAVQTRLNKNTRIGGETGKLTNLFGGIAICGYCGAPMQIVDKGKPPKGNKYLVCDNARRKVKCKYISYKYNEFENAFLSYFNEIDASTVLNLEASQEKSQLSILYKKRSSLISIIDNYSRSIEMQREYLLNIENSDTMGAIIETLSEFNKRKNSEVATLNELERKINTITANATDVDSKINTILVAVKSFNDSNNINERIAFRLKLRNEIRQIVKNIRVFPKGLYYSDEIIFNTCEQLNKDIVNTEDENVRNTIILLKENTSESMRNIQTTATQDNRFFTITFNNGNYRHIKYSKSNDTYRVTMELIGDRLNWMMGDKNMPPIIHEDENSELNAAIGHLKKTNPDVEMTTEKIKSLRNFLRGE